MDVYWLEQSEADLPREDDWLSAVEKACLDTLRVPKRRADWRLGRWTAKRALSLQLNLPCDSRALAAIEIRPAASGAPEAFISGSPALRRISISHCNGTALCAMTSLDTPLGCDLEYVEARSDAFLADYFTCEEQAVIARAAPANRAALVTLLWSAKESALKALRAGLRLDTRAVMVSLPGAVERRDREEEVRFANPDDAVANGEASWRPLEVLVREGERLQGWWRQSDGFVRTLVSSETVNPPIALGIRCE
jgi:4'-phosphopantetheinyl transferase